MATPAEIPPSIEKLLSDERGLALAAGHGRLRTREALREAADRVRRGVLRAGADAAGAILDAAKATLAFRPAAGPRPVVNATGVLLHTNLGRAPLAVAAREAVLRACGYSTLELDLATGSRGKRGEHVRPLLLELFAPGRADLDALAVTNTAAALLLALDTVANGRPVAVSRGELVAIGGDFRVPSILARSGASLLEVGTTNKTTPEDYAEAVRAGAAAILKVRPSNYRIVGFTEEVSLGELASLCREARIPLLFDAGAGSPTRFVQPGLCDEPVPAEALAEGADLVCFSGDKTLGGPQAGILLGAAALVGACAKNPLARALRPDKLVLAALAATLDLHLSGRAAEIPFHAMLADARVPPRGTCAPDRGFGGRARLGGRGGPSRRRRRRRDGDGIDASLVRSSPPPPVARRDRGRGPAPFARAPRRRPHLGGKARRRPPLGHSGGGRRDPVRARGRRSASLTTVTSSARESSVRAS
ncbi:MAG: L-seryl-tRNA(Sec) selenium transferase [Holophagales bacterium]|nr:L-seryl-tRNA(Sec) selenium transferase [Holophagales bacterium]